MAMHPHRKQRLIIVIFIVFGASVAVGLMSFALRENINLFYPPTEIAAGKAPVDKQIRAGGMVLEGSVKRATDSLRVEFIVTDYVANVPVVFTGILPDLFSEGEGIVATGKLDASGVFQASEVLAKHDENYMPPEVQDAVDKAAELTKN
ncbi:MAG: cytochrome c-type biogenesis protein CcmE [Oceanicoccus sp.]|jgi:cytochrome c-type biogenesis protein CcmE